MNLADNPNLKQLHDDLALFSVVMFPYRIEKKYGIPEFHKEIYKHVLENHERSIYLAPRGYSKSTILSFIYILHQVLFEERQFIVIISNTLQHAVDLLEAIKYQLEANKAIRKMFGNFVAKRSWEGVGVGKWTEKEIVTNNNITIRAKGSGQQLRGSLKLGKRPDLIVCDDLEDEDNTGTPDVRAKCADWFDGTVLPSYEGRIIIGGTILHEESLLANLWKAATGRQVGQRYSDDLRKSKPGAMWQGLFYRNIDEKGDSIWPKKFSNERIAQLKADFASRNNLKTYYREYENRARGDDDIEIPESYLSNYHDLDFEKHPTSGGNGYLWKVDETGDTRIPVSTTIGVDLGFTKNKRSNFSAFVPLHMQFDGQKYLDDIIKIRMDVADAIELIFTLREKYNKPRFVFEKNSMDAVLQWLRVEERKRNIYIDKKVVVESTDKIARIRAIIPFFREGQVLLRPSSSEILKDEAYDFPTERPRGGHHYDAWDACEKALTNIHAPYDKTVNWINKTSYHKKESEYNWMTV